MPIQLPILGTTLAALVAAAILSLITTPVVRSLAFKVGAVDVPKDARRMHSRPIPRMGGLAIFLGFMLSASTTFTATPSRCPNPISPSPAHAS